MLDESRALCTNRVVPANSRSSGPTGDRECKGVLRGVTGNTAPPARVSSASSWTSAPAQALEAQQLHLCCGRLVARTRQRPIRLIQQLLAASGSTRTRNPPPRRKCFLAHCLANGHLPSTRHVVANRHREIDPAGRRARRPRCGVRRHRDQPDLHSSDGVQPPRSPSGGSQRPQRLRHRVANFLVDQCSSSR